MVIARRLLIREGEVGTFHVIGRCVRRAWLCGIDSVTGQNYEHRKAWVRNRLRFLTQHFGVEVCGYAVMSTHYHAILRTRPDIVANWTSDAIAKRWWHLFPKRKDKFGNPEDPKDHELDEILFDKKTGDPLGRLELLRKRLASISWFMRCLNESIARRANREDKCKGRFWEGRFKSIELLDQAAVLACLTYVDLNPIHAGVAPTPESSDFTSGQDRIRAKISKDQLKALREEFQARKIKIKNKNELQEYQKNLERQSQLDQWLSPIGKTPLNLSFGSIGCFLNMNLTDYLEILDWSGRQFRLDKSGKIPKELTPILERMAIETEKWLETVERFNSLFHRVAGRLQSLKGYAEKLGQKWMAGRGPAQEAFR